MSRQSVPALFLSEKLSFTLASQDSSHCAAVMPIHRQCTTSRAWSSPIPTSFSMSSFSIRSTLRCRSTARLNQALILNRFSLAFSIPYQRVDVSALCCRWTAHTRALSPSAKRWNTPRLSMCKPSGTPCCAGAGARQAAPWRAAACQACRPPLRVAPTTAATHQSWSR